MAPYWWTPTNRVVSLHINFIIVIAWLFSLIDNSVLFPLGLFFKPVPVVSQFIISIIWIINGVRVSEYQVSLINIDKKNMISHNYVIFFNHWTENILVYKGIKIPIHPTLIKIHEFKHCSFIYISRGIDNNLLACNCSHRWLQLHLTNPNKSHMFGLNEVTCVTEHGQVQALWDAVISHCGK